MLSFIRTNVVSGKQGEHKAASLRHRNPGPKVPEIDPNLPPTCWYMQGDQRVPQEPTGIGNKRSGSSHELVTQVWRRHRTARSSAMSEL